MQGSDGEADRLEGDIDAILGEPVLLLEKIECRPRLGEQTLDLGCGLVEPGADRGRSAASMPPIDLRTDPIAEFLPRRELSTLSNSSIQPAASMLVAAPERASSSVWIAFMWAAG